MQAGDELFGLPPEEFVAARDELARRLRREGDAEAAKQVKALRRPPLSAWAVNRLARERGRALGPLLAAGERLRAAHQAALAGEGAAELRSAAKAEREAVAGLVETALELLREAGHPTTDATRDRVAATLHAAAASPEAADLVRNGRLTTDLDPSGFGTATDAAFDDEAAVAAAGRAAGRGSGRGRRAGRDREDTEGGRGRAGRRPGGAPRTTRRPGGPGGRSRWRPGTTPASGPGSPPTRPCWPPARPSGWAGWPTRPSGRPAGRGPPPSRPSRRPARPASAPPRRPRTCARPRTASPPTTDPGALYAPRGRAEGGHVGEAELEIHPLTRDRWDDLVTLFDRPGDPKGCWCMF